MKLEDADTCQDDSIQSSYNSLSREKYKNETFENHKKKMDSARNRNSPHFEDKEIMKLSELFYELFKPDCKFPGVTLDSFNENFSSFCLYLTNSKIDEREFSLAKICWDRVKKNINQMLSFCEAFNINFCKMSQPLTMDHLDNKYLSHILERPSCSSTLLHSNSPQQFSSHEKIKLEELSVSTTFLSSSTQKLLDENKELKNNLQNLKEVCKLLLTSHETLKKNYIELQTQVEGFQTSLIPSNGELLWWLDNVSNKILSAKRKDPASIFSPPFFSNPTGHKLSARIYLNGDGAGENTHLSMFLCLMKGPYDNMIKWPFPYHVGFTILDLSFGKEHFSKVIRPDPKSRCFMKPTSEKNPSSGLPTFLPLENLKYFIVDNKMLIKINIINN